MDPARRKLLRKKKKTKKSSWCGTYPIPDGEGVDEPYKNYRMELESSAQYAVVKVDYIVG